MAKVRVPWDQRCVCVSFVKRPFRCDRRAVIDGRCAKHAEPMHRDKPLWTDADGSFAPRPTGTPDHG